MPNFVITFKTDTPTADMVHSLIPFFTHPSPMVLMARDGERIGNVAIQNEAIATLSADAFAQLRTRLGNTPDDCSKGEPVHVGYACDDCIQAIANDDYTGMNELQAEKTRAGIARADCYLSVGEDCGFMHRGCEICGDRGAGNKHAIFTIA